MRLFWCSPRQVQLKICKLMAKPKWRTTRAWSSTSAWVQQQLVQNRRQQAAHLLPLPTRLLLALESQVSPVMMTNLAHRTTQHQTPNSNRQSTSQHSSVTHLPKSTISSAISYSRDSILKRVLQLSNNSDACHNQFSSSSYTSYLSIGLTLIHIPP